MNARSSQCRSTTTNMYAVNGTPCQLTETRKGWVIIGYNKVISTSLPGQEKVCDTKMINVYSVSVGTVLEGGSL